MPQKQERKFYLFRDDVFHHGALDEYVQCYPSYGCTESLEYDLCSDGSDSRSHIVFAFLLRLVPGVRTVAKGFAFRLPCDHRRAARLRKGHHASPAAWSFRW